MKLMKRIATLLVAGAAGFAMTATAVVPANQLVLVSETVAPVVLAHGGGGGGGHCGFGGCGYGGYGHPGYGYGGYGYGHPYGGGYGYGGYGYGGYGYGNPYGGYGNGGYCSLKAPKTIHSSFESDLPSPRVELSSGV